MRFYCFDRSVCSKRSCVSKAICMELSKMVVILRTQARMLEMARAQVKMKGKRAW